VTVREQNDGRATTLRILLSPDKFKGVLSAPEVARAMAEGVRQVTPGASIKALPVADGGEGTVEAVVAAGARKVVSCVLGPLGDPVEAAWALLGGTAVVEISAASGLTRVQPSGRSALLSDTFGTGQLMLEAMDAGAHRIVLGLGGSASTDGGAGILRALGARFFDAAGDQLAPGGAALVDVERIDLTAMDPRLANVAIELCCDVVGPMVGPKGAAAVFGPQKGASSSDVQLLDRGLRHFAAALLESTERDATAIDWGGAAGGTSGGLFAALGAQYSNGIDTVANLIGLDDELAASDLVFVGEGSLDSQSLQGKAPIGVARKAQAHGVPAIAVAGALRIDPADLRPLGIMAAVGASDLAGSSEESIRSGAKWVREATAAALRLALQELDHPSPGHARGEADDGPEGETEMSV
jgi:glycerate kinase